MKTIFINAKFLCENLTGIGRFSVEISKQLKTSYPNLVFVAPPNIVLTEIAEELGVETFGIFTGALWEQLELPLYLKKHKNPLLLNLTNTAPIFYKNQINTIHDITSIKHPNWYSKKAALYYKFLLPHVAKNCKNLLTVSNYVKKDLITFFKIDPNNIFIVPNAVSEVFKENKTISTFDYKYILAVGSIDPRKNLVRLINAFSKLENKTIKLILVGQKHKSFSEIKFDSTKEKYKNIVFTGYISDSELVNYYKNAELFIFPSLEEGFGIPPLEAMSCNCPVLVSNLSSMPEVCKDAAIYFNPYDTEDLWQKMNFVLQDTELLADLKEKGKKRAAIFCWQKSALIINDLINNYILKN